MALNRDITEVKLVQQDQKRAEIQLQQYSEQIDNILESITDGFFVLDQHFRVKLWNREAERITRLSAAEMIGQSIWRSYLSWSIQIPGSPFTEPSKRK